MSKDKAMNSDDLIEAPLIRGLKRGSVDAFTAIYNLYFQRMYVYCLQFTKSRSDAEDIVQEVFAQLWSNRDKITSENSIRSLIYIIARNFLVKAYRQNIKLPVFEDYVAYCNSLGCQDVSSIEYEEFLRFFEQCVEGLPKAWQPVVRLSKIDNLTNKEIAQKLNLNEQSVKNYLSQGLKQIRGKLKPIIFFIVLFLVNLLRYMSID